jgi:hypothetical protein
MAISCRMRSGSTASTSSGAVVSVNAAKPGSWQHTTAICADGFQRFAFGGHQQLSHLT